MLCVGEWNVLSKLLDDENCVSSQCTAVTHPAVACSTRITVQLTSFGVPKSSQVESSQVKSSQVKSGGRELVP